MDTHPINDLPAEIIVQILLMYVQGVSFRHNNSRGRWVVKISSVCRFWRSIVLDTKSFWCTIFGPGMRFAQLCLERSGDAPLVVEFRTEGAEYVQMIRSVLPRVREVHFRDSKRLFSVSEILQSLDRPAPHLRVLNISLEYGAFGFGSRTLPTVFAGVTPQLRVLRVDRFFGSSGNKFRNLSHLSLNAQPRDGRASGEQFLSFLAESPRLQSLHLGDAGPSVTRQDAASEGLRLSLPYLCYLELKWCPTELPHFLLSRLALPATVRMKIWKCTTDDISTHIRHFAVLEILPDPDATVPTPWLQGIVELHLDVPFGTTLHALTPASGFSLALDHRDLDPVACPEACFLSVFDRLSLSSLRHLHLGSLENDWPRPRYSMNAWKGLFDNVPDLRELTLLQSIPFESIISALTAPYEGTSALRCPRLRTLNLYFSDDRPRVPPSVSELVQCRAQYGCPLDRLVVFCCSPIAREEATRELLRHYVRTVRFVDGEPESLKRRCMGDTRGSWAVVAGLVDDEY